MNWISLTSDTQLDQIKEHSFSRPQVIFKHSTRCGISSMVKNRLERNDQPTTVDFYFLDLIAHRDLSRQVADVFSVEHESPQALLIKNGQCIYNESHSGITMDDLVEKAEAA